jgi:hypothetical protein
MKKYFFMNCDSVMDTVYEAEKDSLLPLLSQMRIGFHLWFCPRCDEQIKALRHTEEIMKIDFLPPAPGIEDILMTRLQYEESVAEPVVAAPAGFSFRGWVVIGFFVLLSLTSAFFGMNFVHIATVEGSSFLLPVGLTIGVVLTCYGALFIGSHLKELAARFGLR